jgi:NAD(P)-dependent dehydrogenase (short-subunit alcohol dehydrogenase family)
MPAFRSPAPSATLRRIISTAGFGNVRGPVFGLQAALPAMGEGGAVVLIGSVAGVISVAGYGTYAATKAALRSYARTWTLELATRGIRVNALAPGPTDTAMMAVVPEQVRAALIAPIPLGRMAAQKRSQQRPSFF